MFLVDGPQLTRAIRQATDQGDGQRLASSAHALKGSAGLFGKQGAYETARRLEQLGKSGDLTGWRGVHRAGTGHGRIARHARRAAQRARRRRLVRRRQRPGRERRRERTGVRPRRAHGLLLATRWRRGPTSSISTRRSATRRDRSNSRAISTCCGRSRRRPCNGTVLFEVSNRGGKGMLSMFNRGDQFLFDRGYTLVWLGWQFDVPDQPDLLRLYAPIAKGVTGVVRAEIVVDRRETHALGSRPQSPPLPRPAARRPGAHAHRSRPGRRRAPGPCRAPNGTSRTAARSP